MRLYLDDDSASALLARLLRQAGHDVRPPAEIGTVGGNDAVHLTHAVREDRTCLSHNYDDFEELIIRASSLYEKTTTRNAILPNVASFAP